MYSSRDGFYPWENSFAESWLWTCLQMAGHRRGFFVSLRMFGNGEVFYWVRISLQNPSHCQLLKKGRKSEEREGSIGLRQGLKLCTGPASYRAPLIALEVTSSQWLEFQINWGAVSPWEQHGGNKMGNKVNIYSPGLLILSASFTRYLRVPWVEEGKAHRCLSSQIYSFPSLFQPIPKMSSPNSEH